MLDLAWRAEDGAIYEPMETLPVAAELLHEVREASGTPIALAIDVHHRLSPAEAAVFYQRVEPLGMYFVDEPIRCENSDACAQLRTMTTVPFAIREEFSSRWAFAPYIERGLTNGTRIDTCNAGGLSESKKVAARAKAHDIDVMPHSPLGPISTAACIHLAASINTFATLEYSPRHDVERDRDLFPDAPEIDGTAVPLPTGPGLGVTFNPDAAKDNPFDCWSPPRLQRAGGSYTNW